MAIISGTTAQRIERKFPLPDEQLPEVIEAVQTYLPVYRYTGSHDWSSLRTTYLDTEDLRCFQEYLQALPVRKKIRIRQYGVESTFEKRAWVELKIKDHNLSKKRRFCCSTAEAARFLQREDIEREVHAQNSEDRSKVYPLIQSMIAEQNLRPVVRVDYERISFQHPDHPDVRVTIDRHLQFKSATQPVSGQLRGLILELKHSGARPAWMAELRQKLDLRRRKRYSKFARSMRKLDKLQKSP